MMAGLMSRVSMQALARAEAVKRSLAEGIARDLPGRATIEVAPEGLILSGRHLAARFIADPKLRALASLARGLVR